MVGACSPPLKVSKCRLGQCKECDLRDKMCDSLATPVQSVYTDPCSLIPDTWVLTADMSLLKSSWTRLRQSVGWSNSRRSWEERIGLLLLAAAVAGVWWYGRSLSA